MFSNNQPSATGTQQILYGLHIGLDLSQTILNHVMFSSHNYNDIYMEICIPHADMSCTINWCEAMKAVWRVLLQPSWE